MNTFVFQPGLTWRKAGFALFSDSLAYREILEANPVWDITQSPPPGSLVNSPASSSVSASGTVAMRSMASATYSSSLPPENYYPFETSGDYFNSLNKYNFGSLKSVDRNNGWVATSTAVIAGNQSLQ